jgi:hypothetical protein
MNVVETSGLGKRYGGTWALRWRSTGISVFLTFPEWGSRASQPHIRPKIR